MAETTKTFTPEQKLAFEEKYNLGVYSHDALVELLVQFDERLVALEDLHSIELLPNKWNNK